MDGIFLAGMKTREELEAVHAEVKVPLLLGGAGDELGDSEYLARHGVRVALQGHLPFQAAVKTVYDTLKALRDGTPPADLDSSLASAELMARVTRREDYDRWVEEFLG